jgi:hypothetical protein
MAIQIIINQVAFVSVNITEEVRTLNFLTNHITVIHNHRLVIGENRNPTNNRPNNTKSTKAVIFASAANQKNNPAIIMYLSISFLSEDVFLFCKNIKPASSANNDRAITHKSVLLSTITRKAHIQPVNHKSNIYHHIVTQFQFLISASTMPLFHFFKSEFSSAFSFLL